MDLLDLFKRDKEFQRISLLPKRSAAPSELSVTLEAPVTAVNNKSEINGTSYAQKYIDEENRKTLEAAKLANTKENEAKYDEISVGTVPTTANEIDNEDLTKIYNTFDFEYRPKDNLPIVQSKDEIISTIQTHSITVIEGVTGCGKSTQVPQFILDSCYRQRKHCNIVVTQPRRIAALSIANRVSAERGWPLGTLVGCQVGLYRNTSRDTRLTYCTTGVLLRKLITAKNMLEYTHIILDEVHERDQEMDFLLLIIRKLLRTNSRQVKVVLMSATFNVKKFSEYFSVPTETGFVPAPVITIPKKRNYKVHVHYLCQLQTLGTIPEIAYNEPKVTEKMIQFCIKLINVFDDIDSKSEYDVEDLVEFDGKKPRHATLIFLPGIWEIEEMHGLLSAVSESLKWDIVILHSSITHEEQAKIFSNPPTGYRRIILSTNIAESSITIDDVKYVIDFCLTRQLITDPSTNFQCLELTWASKANCEQRAGRAGRVMDGRVYRLVPKTFYEYLSDESDPEIVRAPLEKLVLQTKLLDMGEPKAVLALAIDPPDLTNLERTILLLKETGGLLDRPNVINKFDGELTDLGKIMAALPIDIHLAKLIALGHVFNVLRDTIIMSASMALKSMFNNPFQKRMEAYNAKIHWADGSTSDCLAFLNAYRVWQREIAANRIKKKTNSEKSWGNRNFIQIKVIHEIDFLVSELTRRLERLGIKETMGPKKIVMDEIDRGFILKIVIAGAFYPNYFVRNCTAITEDDKPQYTKTLGGLDPTRTVFLQGWKPEHPGRLYAKKIQEIFKDVVPSYKQTLVEFDSSFRIYIMFADDKIYGNEKKIPEIPGNVSLSVYKALKLRKLGTDITIPVLDIKSAKQMAGKLHIMTNACSMFFTNENYEAIRNALPKTLPLLPPLGVSTVSLKVVNFINPSKFWIQINDPNTLNNLTKIQSFLNDNTLARVTETPSIGSLLAAKYENNHFCRVIIEAYYKVKNEDLANVLYIDFGYRKSVRVADLRMINSDHEIMNMRALANECTLSNVQPSRKKDAKGLWSKDACDLFKKYVQESNEIMGTIYSVVDSIVSLKLTCKTSTVEINLNDLLISKGLAEFIEENYLSKYNHLLREQVTGYNPLHQEYYEYLQYDKTFLINTYPDPPPAEECRSIMMLKGPYSPLEISLSSLSIHTANKKVCIDGLSVNSILLDTNPEDPHERLLVSSIVSQNQNGTHLTLRNTTLMPNIPGLTALLCLIFAPKVELRRSSTGTYYVGALCGLGSDPRNGAPLLPEHDMKVQFDTEITIEDMQNINRLRYWMNMGICVKTDENDDLDKDALQCQQKVHEFLRKLTDRPTKAQKPEIVMNFGKWGLYDESLFLLPPKAAIKDDSIYPLHRALLLEERNEYLEDMTVHMYELRQLAISDPRLQENIQILCRLCNEEIYGREALRVHLFMNDHKNKEKQIGFKKT